MKKVKLSKKLRELSLIFPETAEEVELFEKNVVFEPIPSNWESPEIVLNILAIDREFTNILVNNESKISTYRIAARDGKVISQEILDKLKKDKEQAKKEDE